MPARNLYWTEQRLIDLKNEIIKMGGNITKGCETYAANNNKTPGACNQAWCTYKNKYASIKGAITVVTKQSLTINNCKNDGNYGEVSRRGNNSISMEYTSPVRVSPTEYKERVLNPDMTLEDRYYTIIGSVLTYRSVPVSN